MTNAKTPAAMVLALALMAALWTPTLSAPAEARSAAVTLPTLA